MKKRYLLVPVLFALIYACGGQGNQENTDNSQTQSNTKAEAKQEHKGKELIAKSDCSACHADKSKLVGPSYADIASKYDNTEENHKYLADKIVKGGSGVWGDVPMTPHPQLGESDLKEIVDYIFTLKN